MWFENFQVQFEKKIIHKNNHIFNFRPFCKNTRPYDRFINLFLYYDFEVCFKSWNRSTKNHKNISMKKNLLFLLLFTAIFVNAQNVTIAFKAPQSTPDNASILIGSWRLYGGDYGLPARGVQLTKVEADNYYRAEVPINFCDDGIRFILNNNPENRAQWRKEDGTFDIDSWGNEKYIIEENGKTVYYFDQFVKWTTDNTVKWGVRKAPVMTKWSENIDPDNVLPEYPRPQFERSEWLNLNGIWDFKFANDKIAYSNEGFDEEILVPFPVESAISGIMTKRKYHVWYKRNFTVPTSWNEKRIQLNFGAVDWECEVFVNTQSIGTHTGGYTPFSFDITDYLKAGTEQELIVRVYDPTDSREENVGQPTGKQWNNPGGIFYTPTTGIWQTVWLEPVAQTHIKNMNMFPDVDNNNLKLTVNVENAVTATVVKAIIKDGERIIYSQNINYNQEVVIPISNPKLWSPDSPFLYTLELELQNGEKQEDKINSYFAMRKVSVGEWAGKKRIMLNNEYIFNFGPLDQGFWPDGIYTAPSDEALLWDLEQTKKFGFNTTRKHIKLEPARWYYHCDRLGLMVWQDMVCMPPWGGGFDNEMPDPEKRENFKKEVTETIDYLKNVPSIIMWIVFNENWGQFNTVENTEYVMSLDNSRLVSGASGWWDFEIGDIIDKHNYEQPAYPVSENNTRIAVLGEYGGVGLYYEDHSWRADAHIYDNVENAEQLYNKFSLYAERIDAFAKQQGLSGAIYTQITDVEEEVNGLITYDRKIIKGGEYNMTRMHDLIQYVIRYCTQSDDYTEIFSMTDEWQYTKTEPLGNWTDSDFNDNLWESSRGGFGSGDFPVYTNADWQGENTNIWLRKTFNPGNLSQQQIQNIFANMLIDGTLEVYINGVLAVKFLEDRTPINELHYYHLSQESKNAIRPNEDNTIAVHCHNRVGGAHIGVGLGINNAFPIEVPPTSDLAISSSVSFSVYPNPAKDEITVLFSEPLKKNEMLELYSINGEKMIQAKVNENQTTVSLPLVLNKGMYLLKVRNQSLKFFIN